MCIVLPVQHTLVQTLMIAGIASRPYHSVVTHRRDSYQSWDPDLTSNNNVMPPQFTNLSSKYRLLTLPHAFFWLSCNHIWHRFLSLEILVATCGSNYVIYNHWDLSISILQPMSLPRSSKRTLARTSPVPSDMQRKRYSCPHYPHVSSDVGSLF